LVSKFFENVHDFGIDFSIHSEVRSQEILPWYNVFLWHWWISNLVFVKIFQALNNSVDFISFGVYFMGPLLLGCSSIYFVLLSIFIHNLLLLC
jgi:hypothetical protein